MKSINYITKKIINRIIFFFTKKYLIGYGVYHLKNKKKNNYKIRKIVLDISDNNYFHLGDTLFYEPILRLFIKNKIKVEVIPTNTMKFYFKKLNYKVVSNSYLTNEDLIITSLDCMVGNLKRNTIIIDTSDSRIKGRLIDHLVNVLSKYFNFNKKIKSVPDIPVSKSTIHKNFFKKDVVVFSNYIDSGNFRVFNNKKERLLNFVKNFSQKNNCLVIHVGTLNEKLNDKKKYHHIKGYQDYRGKTSVDDLLSLFQNLNITYIGFDNFLMHLAFINESKIFLLSRGRITKKGEFFLRNSINPPFKSKLNFKLEYIG